MLKLLWRAYEHVAMVVGLSLLAIICLTWTPFALVLDPLLPAARGKRVGRAGIHLGFRLYLRLLTLLCACRFELDELRALAQRREPLVVVANHPSLLDAVILVASLPNAVCIMKGKLMRNVLLGAGARMARYIVNDAPLPMIRSAIGELRDGACLIVFPEGTRTVHPPVDDCANTAGMIAARAGVPVQTVLLEMSTPYLGKHWPMTRPPALPLRCRARLGQRWDPVEQPQQFGARVEAYFREHLDPAANRMPASD